MASERVLAERYRLIEPIGNGGMSVVWRAHDQVLDREVAVKLLNDEVDPALRTRLSIEARAAGALNHPSIAQVYDFGEDGATPYLVMELVHGLPLDRWLAQDNTIPWAQAAQIGADIADALDAVHDRGLVHRDIKPANVIITTRGPKLVDFGICASVGDADETGELVGTPAYVAPERIAGAAAGPAADMYALGVLMYRMTAGVLPWAADSATGLIRAHMWSAPSPLPPTAEIEPDVSAMLVRCLDKDPANRPTAHELAATLSRTRGEVELPGLATASVAGAVARAATHTGGSQADAERATRVQAATFHPTVIAARPEHSRVRRPAQLATACGAFTLVAGLFGVAWANKDDSTPTQAAAPNTVTGPPCAASFAVDRDWGSGFDATVTVNDQSLKLNDWSVAFDFPGDQTVTADRGAEMTAGSSEAATVATNTQQNGSRVVTTATSHALEPGATVKFSLAGQYRSGNPLPTTVLLTGRSCQTRIAGASVAPAPTTARSTGDRGRNDQGGNDNGNGWGHGKGKGKDNGD